MGCIEHDCSSRPAERQNGSEGTEICRKQRSLCPRSHAANTPDRFHAPSNPNSLLELIFDTSSLFPSSSASSNSAILQHRAVAAFLPLWSTPNQLLSHRARSSRCRVTISHRCGQMRDPQDHCHPSFKATCGTSISQPPCKPRVAGHQQTF